LLNLAVLLSGSGTTLQNLIDRIGRGELDARIQIVVSSRENAFGLERAKKHGIPTAAIVRKDYSDAHTFCESIWKTIRDHKVDLVVLAGFMSLLEVPTDFVHRIINVHPALLPAFGGKGMFGHHVHEAVLAYGAKVTGATVHFVDAQYDHGPVILQKAVPVLEDDTPDSLAERVQAAEREIYPEAIQLIAGGKVRVDGRIVHIVQ
jgi:phosphoribosylglycinamide formyltransferase-1